MVFDSDPANDSDLFDEEQRTLMLKQINARYDGAAQAMALYGLRISLDDAVAFLCTALKDPARPLWCARCLIGCILAIRPCGQHMPVLRKNYQTFWASLAGFLTAPRTVDQLMDLDRRWSVCDCERTTGSALVRDLHILTASTIGFRTPIGPGGPLHGPGLSWIQYALAHLGCPTEMTTAGTQRR